MHDKNYWKQRAKAFWLIQGDTNSKFLHATASTRKKINHIAYLKMEDGEVVSQHEDLCSMVQDYFKDVFAGNWNGGSVQVDEEDTLIMAEQNEILTAELSYKKFPLAFKQMRTDKASGPNGLNPVIFPTFVINSR